MTLALFAIPPTQAETRPLWGPDDAPHAQGIEGRQLNENLNRVWWHWSDRTFNSNGDDERANDNSFNHVALPTVATIRVRYSTPQPLKPRRFVLDDEQ